MSTEKAKDTRLRNWRVVVYPDSLPDNWVDILNESCVPWARSPIHDKDKNPDGTPKKPHIHLVLSFRGKKSFEQVKELLAPLNCPIPLKCDDIRGAIRYFAHMDNPEKEPYPISEIIGYNGLDVGLYTGASTSQRYAYIDEMLDFIAAYNIIEFMDFMVYCKYKKRDTWYQCLCDNSAYIIREAIKSNRHRTKRDFIDPETGEILVSLADVLNTETEEGNSLED